MAPDLLATQDRLVLLVSRVPKVPPVPRVFLDRRVSRGRLVTPASWDLKVTAVMSVLLDRWARLEQWDLPEVLEIRARDMLARLVLPGQ